MYRTSPELDPEPDLAVKIPDPGSGSGKKIRIRPDPGFGCPTLGNRSATLPQSLSKGHHPLMWWCSFWGCVRLVMVIGDDGGWNSFRLVIAPAATSVTGWTTVSPAEAGKSVHYYPFTRCSWRGEGGRPESGSLWRGCCPPSCLPAKYCHPLNREEGTLMASMDAPEREFPSHQELARNEKENF
jgi:hypothetical protein